MSRCHLQTKVKAHSLDRGTNFFDIVTGILQGITFASMPRLQTSKDLIKENGFTLKKGKKQMIPCINYYRCRLCI